MIDLALLAPDPRFGGGGRAQTAAFWRGAVELGRKPRRYSLAYRGLAGRPRDAVLEGDEIGPFTPGLDGLNQLLAGVRLQRPIRSARSIWVVAPVASHGYAAARSGRRYGAWIGTTFADEWHARYSGVRRVAQSLSAPALRRLERATIAGATRVYATSPSSRDAVARAGGIEPSAVGILPIPIDTDAFHPLTDEEWASRLARPTIVFVGRADDPRKNARLLLDTWPQIRARVPDARLQLVGSPPRGPVPDGVEVLGEIPDVASALRGAALFVLPSLQEGFGIVAAEALASGVPVLTTPSGGPEELVTRSGGGRVLTGFDGDELAESAAELLTDAATLAAMRRAGREHVVREHAFDRFRELLAAALAEVDG